MSMDCVSAIKQLNGGYRGFWTRSTSLAARRAASHNYPFGAFLAQLKKSSGRFVTFDRAHRAATRARGLTALWESIAISR